jgi:hypothetical protein
MSFKQRISTHFNISIEIRIKHFNFSYRHHLSILYLLVFTITFNTAFLDHLSEANFQDN